MDRLGFVKIYDLFDMDLFQRRLAEGYIRVQTHPKYPMLHIVNYAEKTVYEKKWDDVTLACRGLIYDAETEQILARPFAKFFNFEELPDLVRMDIMHYPATVSNKLDGSMGILYETPSGDCSIATRGSFSSNQALRATQLLREKHPTAKVVHGYTAIFEIIYPENRIVVNYGEIEDLFLLGAVENTTGNMFDPEYAAYICRWGGESTKIMPATSISTAMSLAPRENSEGVVALIRSPGFVRQTMVKIKQADYIKLHKAVTGLSERAVWESMDWSDRTTSLDEQMDAFIQALPDEFHEWAVSIKQHLVEQLNTRLKEIYSTYERIMEEVVLKYSVAFTRKDFAMESSGAEHAGFLFMLLDGKDRLDISEKVWKTLKPEGDTRIFNGVDNG